jgi:hypothetical protein
MALIKMIHNSEPHGVIKMDKKIIEKLEQYKYAHWNPGGLVEKFLSNNLTGLIALDNGDYVNNKLYDLYYWCSKNLPECSWGSADNVLSWIIREKY